MLASWQYARQLARLSAPLVVPAHPLLLLCIVRPCHAAAEKARGRKGKRQQPAASEDTEYDPMRSPGLLQHLGRNGTLPGWQAAARSAAWAVVLLAGWHAAHCFAAFVEQCLAEERPLLIAVAAGSGENAQPNAADLRYSSDSDSDSDDFDSEVAGRAATPMSPLESPPPPPQQQRPVAPPPQQPPPPPAAAPQPKPPLAAVQQRTAPPPAATQQSKPVPAAAPQASKLTTKASKKRRKQANGSAAPPK
jgi:hypothetical protein